MGVLQAIVYVSSAQPLPGEAQLEELLIEARALNLESGVTGALLYSRGSFLQCFEGTPDAVALTYERIRASRRHRGLIELMNTRIAARMFADWTMGFDRVAHSELLRLSTAQWERSAADARSDALPAGVELLCEFWRRRR